MRVYSIVVVAASNRQTGTHVFRHDTVIIDIRNQNNKIHIECTTYSLT